MAIPVYKGPFGPVQAERLLWRAGFGPKKAGHATAREARPDERGLTAPGRYDTHSDQPDALAKGIDLTAKSLLAFQRDLEARGLADRVVVHVWTEFGRRAAENGDHGTDHGAAGTGFLIGSRVKGGLVGEFPGLTTGLDKDGNLRATADFRAVYAALLEQWLDTEAGTVIPNAGTFARPALIR
jgi:uncharacterized protein (DUF1501 family)